jgi:hypothetical protein
MISSILTALLYVFYAHSNHPLLQSTEIIDEGLDLYWKEGQIMVVSQSNKTAYYPFGSPPQKLQPLPSSFDDWKQLESTCVPDQKSISSKVITRDVEFTAEAKSTDIGIQVQWSMKDNVLSDGMIMQQAIPCGIYILQADALEGLEIIVVWKFEPKLEGITIFRIPDTVNY